MLVDPQIEKELRRFVSVRLFTDGNPPERAERNKKYQMDTFNSVTLPLFAFYDSNGKLVNRHEGTATKAQFLAYLRSVK